MRARSLVWRLGLALLVVQAVAGVLLATFAFQRMVRFQHEQTIDLLDRTVGILVAEFEDLVRTGELEELRSRVVRSSVAARQRLTVVLIDGSVLADSERDAATMDNHRLRPEIDTALRTGTGSSIRFSDTLGHRTVYAARSIIDGRIDGGVDGWQPIAVVRAALPLAEVDRELAGLVRTVLGALLVWLLIPVVTIILLSHRVGAAITRLGEGAARFARGDLKHRLPAPNASEFAALTDGLNRMAEQLNDRIEELDTQRDEQEAILRSMQAGIIALDRDHRILRLNHAAERLLEVHAGEPRGRLLQEVARVPQLNRFVNDVLEENAESTDEFAIESSGAVVRATGRSLRDQTGRPVGLLIVLSDVTRLRRLESMRSDFAANVSHELRTPITNIQGYVETLLDHGVDDAEQTRSFLEVIARNAARLGAIVEDILALTRLEREDAHTQLETSVSPVAPLVGLVLGALGTEAAERGTHLVNEASPDAEAAMNGPLLEQALSNLVSNAIKYSPNDTTVTVRTSSTTLENGQPGLAISVQDQGPGVAPEHRARLFERFYRVDKDRSRAQGGTGLGLAIVKHIALLHGGRVELSSTPGLGATFSLVLPCRTPSDHPSSDNQDAHD